MTGQVGSGNVMTGQSRTGKVGHVKSGRVKLGNVKFGQVKSGIGQVRTGPVRRDQVFYRASKKKWTFCIRLISRESRNGFLNRLFLLRTDIHM